MTEQQLIEQAPCARRYQHHRHVWTDHVDDFECTGDPAPRTGVKEYLVPLALLIDPDRWVDADMQRDGWLLVAKYYAAAAVLITVLVIVVGVALRW